MGRRISSLLLNVSSLKDQPESFPSTSFSLTLFSLQAEKTKMKRGVELVYLTSKQRRRSLTTLNWEDFHGGHHKRSKVLGLESQLFVVCSLTWYTIQHLHSFFLPDNTTVDIFAFGMRGGEVFRFLRVCGKLPASSCHEPEKSPHFLPHTTNLRPFPFLQLFFRDLKRWYAWCCSKAGPILVASPEFPAEL